MAQKAKIIDVRRGFLPTDPNAFPENLVGTQQEDSPEDLIRVVPYEGYNFLPTDYGYRSYFGVGSELNIAALTSRCSELLMFQSASFVNMLIALCEDGIWTSNPATAAGIWTQQHITTFDINIFKRWTYTIIRNDVYFYQEAGTLVYKLTNDFVWSSFTPSFLNMIGQKGIFRAGGRLGFWDSANSVSWSSALDYTDFTPNIATTVDNTKFRDVVGNIVSILPQGDGFVIYATKTIVGVTLNNKGNDALWQANVVANNTGISYATHVCLGNSDATHFAYTITGLYSVGVYNQLNKAHHFEPILTETVDFIREALNPVRLVMSEGRFLFISLIDSNYIDGIISSEAVNIPGLTLELLGYTGTEPTLKSNQGVSLINKLVGNPTSYDSSGLVLFVIPGGEWDGTYDAKIDKVAAGIYFTTPVSTARWGAVNNYTPLRHLANPVSEFVNTSVLTVEGALNTWDAWLSELATNQVTTVAAKVASPAVLTTETFPGVGTFPTIPANPADEIVEFGKLLTGAGKDKLIQTGAGTLLNILTLRRYFTDAYKINTRRKISYTGWVGNTVYTTWNPANLVDFSLSGMTLIPLVGGGGNRRATSIINKSAGKWYWEYTFTSVLPLPPDPNSTIEFGIIGTDLVESYTQPYIHGFGIQGLPHGNVVSTTSPITIGIALDSSIGQLSFTANGIAFAVAFTDLVGAFYAGVKSIGGSTALSIATITANFGATPFVYTPPVGFNAGLSAPGNILQGTVSTTYEQATPNLTGNFGYSEIDIKALDFKQWRKNVDETWTLLGTVMAGGATPPAFDNIYPVNAYNTIAFGATNVINSPFQSSSGFPFGEAPATETNPYILPVEAMTITYPGASFNLVAGTPAPLYPTYKGALVLDTHLKKWGKFKGDHKLIVDYNPQNSNSNGAIPYTNFGIRAGILKVSSKIALFDNRPADSWIRYGKIGYYRRGITTLLEVLAHFRTKATGILTVDFSLDGRNLEAGTNYFIPFTDAKNVVAHPDISAKWHTVKIYGQWDLQYLEVRGIVSGRR